MRANQTLVPSQIKGGFPDILKEAQPCFLKSDTSTQTPVFSDDNDLPCNVILGSWKFNSPLLTRLCKWYKIHLTMASDKKVIEAANGELHLRLLCSSSIISQKFFPWLRTTKAISNNLSDSQLKTTNIHFQRVI